MEIYTMRKKKLRGADVGWYRASATFVTTSFPGKDRRLKFGLNFCAQIGNLVTSTFHPFFSYNTFPPFIISLPLLFSILAPPAPPPPLLLMRGVAMRARGEAGG